MQANFGGTSGYSHRLFGPPSLIRKTVESWGEVKSFSSQWEGGRKIGEGGGGGERKIRLPALIVRLRNSVRGRTESLIGAAG